MRSENILLAVYLLMLSRILEVDAERGNEDHGERHGRKWPSRRNKGGDHWGYFSWRLPLPATAPPPTLAEKEATKAYWKWVARSELTQTLKNENLNRNVARNMILFVGNGMSITTITAGRILKGQLQGGGEETKLAIGQFPHVGLAKTYSVDKQVPDAASTATALLCGIKNKDGTLAVDGSVSRSVCISQMRGSTCKSILSESGFYGKSTGIVTTASLLDSSAAASYAHSVEKNWMNDAEQKKDDSSSRCSDLAEQFLEYSTKLKVALGGGRRDFQSVKTFDPEYPTKRNSRTDMQDLIETWLQKTSDMSNYTYVWNKKQFDDVDPKMTDKLLGMFEPYQMQFEVDRDRKNEPSLSEMTEKAIQMLKDDLRGYFLLIEGGRIGEGHRHGNAHLALHEFIAFDAAIAKAVEMTSDSDTLIVVTSNHGSTLSLGGDADRGNPIFGLTSVDTTSDNKQSTTLLYGNGPGYQGNATNDRVKLQNVPVVREDLRKADTESRQYRQQTAVPKDYGSNGGEDVPVFARGPMSHLFTGVHEQNYIPHAMMYASCVGSNTQHCLPPAPEVICPTLIHSVTSKAEFFGKRLSGNQASTYIHVFFFAVCILGFAFVFLLCTCLCANGCEIPEQKKAKGEHNEEDRFAAIFEVMGV